MATDRKLGLIGKKLGMTQIFHDEGKRIGVPRYFMTAAIFMRGLLSDEHGVDFSQVEWIEGDINSPRPHGSPANLQPHKPAKIAFVGDVLFRGSIGRTDFPRGNHEQLLASIRGRLWPGAGRRRRGRAPLRAGRSRSSARPRPARLDQPGPWSAGL